MTATASDASSQTRSPTIFLTQVDSIQRSTNLQMCEKYIIIRREKNLPIVVHLASTARGVAATDAEMVIKEENIIMYAGRGKFLLLEAAFVVQ
jgi:hypothetical protein